MNGNAAIVNATRSSDPHLEEQHEYRKRIGRWRRETADTIEDKSFWHVVAIATASHRPLTHHFNFINSNKYDTTLSEFVCEKADAILAEFNGLIRPAQWASDLLDNMSVDSFDSIEALLRLGVEYHI